MKKTRGFLFLMLITPINCFANVYFSGTGSGGGGSGTITGVTAGNGLIGGGTSGGVTLAVDQSTVTLSGVLIAGSNITLTPSGGQTTISATGGSGASLTSTQTFSGGTSFNSYTNFVGSVTVSNIAIGTIAAGVNIPTQINLISSDTIVNIVGSSSTFNLAVSDWHYLQLSTNTPNGLLVSNPTIGQQFTVILKQSGAGSTLVNWFPGILWPSGTVPTLTTTAGKLDVFTFKTISSGVYLGYTVGQNQ